MWLLLLLSITVIHSNVIFTPASGVIGSCNVDQNLYPGRILSNTFEYNAAINDKRYSLETTVLMNNNTMFYKENSEFSVGSLIYAIQMQGQDQLFVQDCPISDRRTLSSSNDFNACFNPSSYLFPFPEIKWFLTFNSFDPRRMSISHDGQSVAWSDTYSNIIIGPRYLRVYDSVNNAFINMDATKSSITTTSQDTPSQCGSVIYYENFLLDTNRSSIYSYDTMTSRLMEITSSSSINQFYPQACAPNELYSSTWTCSLSYLSSNSSVLLQSNGLLRPSISAATEMQLNIEVIIIPTFQSIIYKPSSWASQSYTRLSDYILTGEFIFVIVSKTDLSSFMIRYINIINGIEFTDIDSSTSTYLLTFLSANEDGLIYTQLISSSTSNTFFLKFSWITETSTFSLLHCALNEFDGNKSNTRITLYKDIVIWGTADGTGNWELLDINKDNDQLFDGADAFPLLHGYIYDSDNDLIPDNYDLVAATGQCVSSTTRGECSNDYKTLYIYWGVFAIVCLLLILAYNKSYSYFLQKATSAKDALENESDQNNSSNPLHNNIETKNTTHDLLLGRLDKIPVYSQLILLVLSVVSVSLAIAVYIPYDGFDSKTLTLISWVDLYINYLFLIDFFIKLFYRDVREHPTILSYLTEQWFCIFALVMQIPGGNYDLPLDIDILKVFRLVRFYEMLTHNQRFVSIMVRNPFGFTALIMAFCILFGSLLLKVMEQYYQQSWSTLDNVIWFSFVTVATVGYGDFAPVNNVSRAVTVVIMLVGIGLISTLSAVIVAQVVTVSKSEGKKVIMKRELELRWNKLKTGLVEIATPFNPMTSIFYDTLGTTKAEKEEKLLQTAERHTSSALNVTVGMQQKIELPVDQIMKGASGKFSVHNLGSQAEIIRRSQNEINESALLKTTVDHDRFYDGALSKLTRLNYVLRGYDIANKEKQGTSNYNEMLEELETLINEPPRANSIYLEKLFHIQKLFETDKDTFPYSVFNYTDPIDDKINRIEEFFDRYGISSRVDFCEIMNEIQIIVLLNDRVETSRWAMKNCIFDDSVNVNPPMFEDIRRPQALLPASLFVYADENIAKEAANIKPSAERNNTVVVPGGGGRRSSFLDSAAETDSRLTSMGSQADITHFIAGPIIEGGGGDPVGGRRRSSLLAGKTMALELKKIMEEN